MGILYTVFFPFVNKKKVYFLKFSEFQTDNGSPCFSSKLNVITDQIGLKRRMNLSRGLYLAVMCISSVYPQQWRLQPSRPSVTLPVCFPARILSPLPILSPTSPLSPPTQAVRGALPSSLSSRISITCHVPANPSLLYSKLLSSSLPPCCLDTAIITQH